jgi:hypothetical protein
MRRLSIGTSIAAILGFLIFIGWSLILPGVSQTAIDSAREALHNKVGSIPEDGTLIVVDFTQPSFRKRLGVIDLKSGRGTFHLVAHGRNSGGLFANEFSDKVGSKMSSLGLYRVHSKYTGRHGLSLRLIGLSRTLNQNAEKRGIVIHSADYVSVNAMLMNAINGFHIGRSEGCFVLSKRGLDALLTNLKPQAFLFAYANCQ